MNYAMLMRLLFFVFSIWGCFSWKSTRMNKSFLKVVQFSTLLGSDGDGGGEEEADDVFGKPVGPLPSVSSNFNFAEEKNENMKHDLWIVGAGTLGEIVCRQYKEQFPTSSVIAETLTPTRHPSLLSLGVEPRLRESRSESDHKSAKDVVIALTPSSCSDYVGAINDAIRLWAGPIGGGSLVFTSSLAVYGDSNGNIVNEKFRLDTRSKRSTILINTEEAILQRNGIVIRLAGLYHNTRGPHTYWMNQAKAGQMIESNSDGYVNMIHYEDAASIVLAALASSKPYYDYYYYYYYID
jgi:hypothetical protein